MRSKVATEQSGVWLASRRYYKFAIKIGGTKAPPYDNTKSPAETELFVYRNNPKRVIISWRTEVRDALP